MMTGKDYAFGNRVHRAIEPTIALSCQTISATEDLANFRYTRGTEIRAGEGISLAKDIPRSEILRKMSCSQCLGRDAQKTRKLGAQPWTLVLRPASQISGSSAPETPPLP